MGKYDVKWCRIWDFTEEVEAETEEEVFEKILEERKTAGSTIEIIAIERIDIEEVKQKAKEKKEEHIEVPISTMSGAEDRYQKRVRVKVEQKKKEKK